MQQIVAVVVILVLVHPVVNLRLVLHQMLLLVRRAAPALHLRVFHFIDLVDVTVA